MKAASVPRLLVVAAAAVAVGLLSVSLRDVVRNPVIMDPEGSVRFIWECIAATMLVCVWACVRPSKLSSYCALTASAGSILWSVLLACV
jgi:hypothetical protein